VSWVGADYSIWRNWEFGRFLSFVRVLWTSVSDCEDGGQVSGIEVYHVELSIVGGFGKGQLYCLCYAKSGSNLPQNVDG
jgi:hypothetical protein